MGRRMKRAAEPIDYRQEVNRDLAWMHRAIGRYEKLVEMEAPRIILRNERNTWEEKYSHVRSCIEADLVHLNGEGCKAWHLITAEFLKVLSYPKVEDDQPKRRKQ